MAKCLISLANCLTDLNRDQQKDQQSEGLLVH
jgi:hypothetical protein